MDGGTCRRPKATIIIAQLPQKARKTEKGVINMAYQKKTNNPNMGRPTTAPKTRRLEIRLTESENDMLLECTEKTGKDRTAIIIEGITSIYKSL